MIPWLSSNTPFPPLETALHEPNGLLAAGGDLSPQRLLAAYRHGIFPWYSPGQPILWWSPQPRMVLFPQELKVSHSLAKRLRRGDYQIRIDSAFRAVMEACATSPRPDQDGTWIVPELVEAYCQLHAFGYAHSVETWIDGELAGGLYGVSIGRMFYGESMFHRVTDASKIAVAHLAQFMVQNGYGMIDCQMQTSHLASLGAREIPREEFAQRLTALVNSPDQFEPWNLHEQNS
jgi:leucyl/phenylalanyl-tRNA--protein transferase